VFCAGKEEDLREHANKKKKKKKFKKKKNKKKKKKKKKKREIFYKRERKTIKIKKKNIAPNKRIAVRVNEPEQTQMPGWSLHKLGK